MKTHRSAVVVIPPEEVWEPIQAVRRLYDRQLERWMPHITLIYPFWPREWFDEAMRDLESVCGGLEPFGVTLEQVERFKHGEGRFTMWFRPEPPEPLGELQAAIEGRFPECDDVSRFGDGYTPHLSFGQARGRVQLAERMSKVKDTWRPVRFEVREVALICREEDGPFEVERTVKLGQ